MKKKRYSWEIENTKNGIFRTEKYNIWNLEKKTSVNGHNSKMEVTKEKGQ